MRNDLLILFDRDNDYYVFLRENPKWHRILSRNPEKLNEFIEEYKIKRRKRLVDKIEDISMMISLAKELM
ncbi:MAG: YlbE-like family protein [Bacillales bacterium]|nr:YlbE-like family protein [Bacillales bacterium]